MNEKLQYATMLEIPVNTCNVTYKPAKRRKRFGKKAKNHEAVKEELLSKVNAESNLAALPTTAENSATEYAETATEGQTEEISKYPDNAVQKNLSQESENAAEETADATDAYESASVHAKKRKPFFRFTAVTAELIVAAVLIAAIFLTNAFYENSAINVFMRKVFAPAATETVKVKTYEEFAPVMNFDGAVSVEDGIVSFVGSGAVYPPCDGVVSSVEHAEDGTYTVCIAHSAAFSSKISGLKYAYLETGDKAFGNIPVGFSGESGVKMCFSSEESVITDYTIENDVVLWAV
ncbi:MAG: hypothetical protein IJU83_04160 [Clostridia bacterium]|nr:hypothetical protein [Clostridia bacterium]